MPSTRENGYSLETVVLRSSFLIYFTHLHLEYTMILQKHYSFNLNVRLSSAEHRFTVDHEGGVYLGRHLIEGMSSGGSPGDA